MSGNGSDDIDGADWFSKQFENAGQFDEPAEAETPTPTTPTTPPPAPQTSPDGFNWGFGAPADAQPPAVQPPAEPPAQQPVEPPVQYPVQPTEPPSPDPALWGAPSAAVEPPTVALPWESAPEPIAAEPPTELVSSPPDPGNPLESLFGDSSFKEYETTGVLAGSSFGGDGGDGPRPPRQKGDPLPRNQRILFSVAGGVIGILVLALLFVIGTKLPDFFGPTAEVVPTPTVTASPTPTAKPVGPVAIGQHKWNELLGGECLNPFTSVWAETFTVVDCTTAHPAQMVYRGTFPVTVVAPSTATPNPTATATAPTTPGSTYPGLAALQAQINLLCTAPGVINLSAAGAYSDLQFQASYAATAEEWDAGQHDFFCFLTRSSGQPITGSLAVPATPAA